jgi:hypothetical protein
LQEKFLIPLFLPVILGDTASQILKSSYCPSSSCCCWVQWGQSWAHFTKLLRECLSSEIWTVCNWILKCLPGWISNKNLFLLPYHCEISRHTFIYMNKRIFSHSCNHIYPKHLLLLFQEITSKHFKIIKLWTYRDVRSSGDRARVRPQSALGFWGTAWQALTLGVKKGGSGRKEGFTPSCTCIWRDRDGRVRTGFQSDNTCRHEGHRWRATPARPSVEVNGPNPATYVLVFLSSQGRRRFNGKYTCGCADFNISSDPMPWDSKVRFKPKYWNS